MKVPQELMDKYREINVGHDWWDCTYDYWKSRLARMGVEVDEINFSGFWSQGDGACFTGQVSSKQIKRFMRIHGMRDRYRSIYTLADHVSIWVAINRNSNRHYSHSNCVTPEAEMEYPSWIDAESDDIRDAVVWELYQDTELWWKDFDKECVEVLRGYMDDIYRDLEKEYDYLTSDEVVAEAIITNDLFTEQE